MNIPVITDYTELAGKVVLVRAGLNVPLQNNTVANTFRIEKCLETIKYLQKSGAITVIVSHIGREKDETLEPVYKYLEGVLQDVSFFKNFFAAFGTEIFGEKSGLLRDTLSHASNGSIILLDNLRQTDAEKQNSSELNVFLRDIADIYVNEAFAVSHRKHSSTYGSAKLFEKGQKFLGCTFHMELENLKKAQKPEKKSLFVLGGAKFETKLPMIAKFIDIYDHVFIGGALFNNILKLKGYEIGRSLHEKLSDDQTEELLEVLSNKKLFIPEYVTCETKNNNSVTKHIGDITKDDMILDIAPQSVQALETVIRETKSILWNGPMGYYEGGYTDGSYALAQLIGSSHAYSVAGGGDTITAIQNTQTTDSFDFLSTGGGSTIQFLSSSALSTIEAMS